MSTSTWFPALQPARAGAPVDARPLVAALVRGQEPVLHAPHGGDLPEHPYPDTSTSSRARSRDAVGQLPGVDVAHPEVRGGGQQRIDRIAELAEAAVAVEAEDAAHGAGLVRVVDVFRIRPTADRGTRRPAGAPTRRTRRRRSRTAASGDSDECLRRDARRSPCRARCGTACSTECRPSLEFLLRGNSSSGLYCLQSAQRFFMQ